MLLEAECYGGRRSYSVKLTPEQKHKTEKHSIPRPEIDILAIDLEKNGLIALEVKSPLDSPGIELADVQVEHETTAGLYRPFTTANYPEIVLDRPRADLLATGMINVAH
jgi:hypothetical protein